MNSHKLLIVIFVCMVVLTSQGQAEGEVCQSGNLPTVGAIKSPNEFQFQYHPNSFAPRVIDSNIFQLQRENLPENSYGASSASLNDVFGVSSTQSFSISFNFMIREIFPDVNGGGVGFAVVLQPSSSPYGRGDRDGNIGYINLPNYFAIEFNTLGKSFTVRSRNSADEPPFVHATLALADCPSLPQVFKNSVYRRMTVLISNHKIAFEYEGTLVFTDIDVSRWSSFSGFRFGFTASEGYQASEEIYISSVQLGLDQVCPLGALQDATPRSSAEFSELHHPNSFIPIPINSTTIRLQRENYPYGGFGATTIFLSSQFTLSSGGSFIISFDFFIHDEFPDPGNGGVGFAVVLQPANGGFLLGGRGGIGYWDLPSYVAVEFNTLLKTFAVRSRLPSTETFETHASALLSDCSNLPQAFKDITARHMRILISDDFKLSFEFGGVLVFDRVDVSRWSSNLLSNFLVGLTAAESYEASENIYISQFGAEVLLPPPVDSDGDGIADADDNCPTTPNVDQKDQDGDGDGDACDNDLDGDGFSNAADNCPTIPNSDQKDQDEDGVGDACDNDVDGDGIPNDADNCPNTPNPDQNDQDEDGKGDACDDDIDGDGFSNAADNCPTVYNPDQKNTGGGPAGDACDPIVQPPPPANICGCDDFQVARNCANKNIISVYSPTTCVGLDFVESDPDSESCIPVRNSRKSCDSSDPSQS